MALGLNTNSIFRWIRSIPTPLSPPPPTAPNWTEAPLRPVQRRVRHSVQVKINLLKFGEGLGKIIYISQKQVLSGNLTYDNVFLRVFKSLPNFVWFKIILKKWNREAGILIARTAHMSHSSHSNLNVHFNENQVLSICHSKTWFIKLRLLHLLSKNMNSNLINNTKKSGIPRKQNG